MFGFFHQEGIRNLQENTTKRLKLELCFTLILILSIALASHHDTTSFMVKCKVDARRQVEIFLAFTMIPTLILRMVAYRLFKNHLARFQSSDFSLDVYFYTTFGLWTISNFIKMMHAPKSCGTVTFSTIKLCYHILLILGIFPGVILMIGAFLLWSCLPYALIQWCVERRRLGEEKRKREKLMQGLFHTKWHAGKFEESNYCCICASGYDTKDTVIVLPCHP
jgi:hypothetical protein